MTQDDRLAVASGRETSALRCSEFTRTDRGWERCHRDEHAPGTRHHVRDRSWVSTENTPRLRFGQPCGAACAWPDLVIPYRSGTGRGGDPARYATAKARKDHDELRTRG